MPRQRPAARQLFDAKVLARGLQAAIQAVQRLQADYQRQQVLFELSLAINAKLDDPDAVLNLILGAAIDSHKLAETGSLFRFDSSAGKLVLVRKRGLHQQFVQYSEFAVGEGVAGQAAATMSSVLVNDCQSDWRYLQYTTGADQIRSIFAVPVTVPGSGDLLGVLCIHNSSTTREFSEADTSFVEALARIAGVAWQNSLTHSRLSADHTYDAATGLLNREGIEKVLDELVGKAKLSGQPLSILYMDLDGLKLLNDKYDTDVGDAAITVVADTIKKRTFSTYRDKAGKWKAGDEFVVALPGATAARAVELAETIRVEVERTAITGVDTPLPHTTISIGVAEITKAITTGHELALKAEQAKTRAKSEGKNRVVVFTPGGATWQ